VRVIADASDMEVSDDDDDDDENDAAADRAHEAGGCTI
jgi:hypothetical protein